LHCSPFQKSRMRIPKPWVPLLTKKIIDNILSKNLAKPNVSQEKLIAEAEAIILEELTVEDRLNEEVRGLLKGHASEIEKGRLDYRKLFDLTKQKLVKERNLIL
jgi:hypothetical protein